MRRVIVATALALIALGCRQEVATPPAAQEPTLARLSAEQSTAVFAGATLAEPLAEAQPRDIENVGVRVTEQGYRLRFQPAPGSPGSGLPDFGSLVAVTVCTGNFCNWKEGCRTAGCSPDGQGGCTPLECIGCAGGGGPCSASTSVVGDPGLIKTVLDRYPALPTSPVPGRP